MTSKPMAEGRAPLAFSQEITPSACYQRDCGKRATREVYDRSGSLDGYYCAQHAREVVAGLNAEEQGR